MTLDVGTAYNMTFAVTNSSGTPVAPASATLTITQPDQTPAAGSPFTVTPATLLTQPFTAVQAGLHMFQWDTVAPTLQKIDYENFRNFASAISLAAAKLRLGQDPTKTLNDEKIRLLMSAATREVEKVVGTLVPRVFTNEMIGGTYRDVLPVQHGPIFMPPGNTQSNGSVTSLRSAYPQGPSWPAGGTTNELLVMPSPGTIRHVGLIPFWYGPWLVTYTGGVSVVEEPIAEGIEEVLFDMWQQMRGLTADMVSNTQDVMTGLPGYRLPARALNAIKGYELPGFG